MSVRKSCEKAASVAGSENRALQSKQQRAMPQRRLRSDYQTLESIVREKMWTKMSIPDIVLW